MMNDSNNLSSLPFFASLLGTPRDVKTTTDGATRVMGEIASGIPMEMVFRPSTSSGAAVDVKIDGKMIRHIEGTPNLG